MRTNLIIYGHRAVLQLVVRATHQALFFYLSWGNPHRTEPFHLFEAMTTGNDHDEIGEVTVLSSNIIGSSDRTTSLCLGGSFLLRWDMGLSSKRLKLCLKELFSFRGSKRDQAAISLFKSISRKIVYYNPGGVKYFLQKEWKDILSSWRFLVFKVNNNAIT